MEVLAVIVVVSLLMAYYGLFDSLEIGASMASREVRDAERDQKARLAKKAASRKVDKKTMDAAIASNDELDAYDI